MDATPPAPSSAATPAVRTPRRWWRHSLGALAALLMLAVLALWAVWQALGSARGSVWLLSHISGLTVEDARGSLRGGPFSASAVDFRIQGSGLHVHIEGLNWQDLQWQWRPDADAWSGWTVTGLRAQRVEVRRGPSTGPLRVQRLDLPFRLEVRDAQVQTLQIDQAAPVQDLRLSLALGAEHGALHRVQNLAFVWEHLQWRADGDIGTRGRLPLRLQASVRPSAPAASAVEWQGTLEARGPLAAIGLHATARAEATPLLDLDATLTPLAEWPLGDLQASFHALDLQALHPRAPRTRLEGHAVLRSTSMTQPARLELELDNTRAGAWNAQALPLAHLALAVEGRPDRLNSLAVKAFDVHFGDGPRDTGHWQGEGRWQGGVLQLQTRLADVALAGLDARLPAVRLRGPLNLSLEPQKDGAAPRALLAKLDAQLQGAPIAPGTPAFTIGTRADALLPSLTTTDGWQLALRELKASAGDAQAIAFAQAARHGERWQATGHGELHRFDPAQWWRGDAASAWRAGHHRLNGRWAFEGEGPAAGGNSPLAGHASLQLDPSTLADVPLQGHASLKTAGAQAIAFDAALDSGPNHLQGRGQWHWPGRRGKDAWDLQARLPDLAMFGPLARLSSTLTRWAPTAGNGTLEAHFEGRWPRMRSTGRMELNGVKAGDFSAAALRSQWQADLASTAGEVPLDASLAIEQARLGAQAVPHLDARLTGSARAHRLALRVDTAARPPAWAETLANRGQPIATALLLHAAGRWTPGADADRWSLQIEDLKAGAPQGESVGGQLLDARDVHAELGFAPEGGLRQINAEPGSVRLLGAALQWSALRWQAGADAAAPPRVDVQARLEPLRVAPLLARLQPDFGWGGDLAVRGHLVIRTGSAVHIDTVVERDSGDLSVTDEGGTQTLGLTDLRLGLAADEGRWYFTQALAGQTVGVLAGAQSLQLPAHAWWPTAQTPMQGVLELRVDNLGVWGPWTPPGWRLAGTLHTVATLGGHFGAPEYTGQLEAHGLGARNLLEGVNVTDGEVQLALNGPTAEVQQFTVKGGDGTATLSGGASFGESPRAQLQLKATRFQLLGRVDRRVVASGQAQLQLQKDAVALAGQVRIDEGLFDFSRSNAPTLDDDVSVVRPSKASETPAPAATAKPRRVDLQMAVDLGDRLRLRGHGIDTLLRGELRMSTPNGKFAVHGTVRADQGTYAAYGQKLDIERGLVEFNGALIDPRLDILALRPNVDVRVGVAVTGTAQKPRVRLYSEPEMPDNDKLSWLVLGRAPENLGHNDAALLQHAAMALLAGEGDTPTDRVMQALGLDEFTVRQQGEGDVRTTIVSLGKQISRRWYVGYERGLQSTTGTWALIYRIAQRFTLRAQSGEDNAIDVIWSWRWN